MKTSLLLLLLSPVRPVLAEEYTTYFVLLAYQFAPDVVKSIIAYHRADERSSQARPRMHSNDVPRNAAPTQ